jgi:hypothetical protein
MLPRPVISPCQPQRHKWLVEFDFIPAVHTTPISGAAALLALLLKSGDELLQL